MNNSIIVIPKGTEYMSDVLHQLPQDCLFNKGKAGAGGTSIALTNEFPTVICVPYLSMIDNKISQSKEDRQFYPHEIFDCKEEGWSNFALAGYLERVKTPKIMVTYNSLPRLIDVIDFDSSYFHLLIDEYHCLFTEYVFRNPAVKGVLSSFRKFKSFTFMSATPIDSNCLLKELIGIPIVTAEWEDKSPLKIDSIHCKFNLNTTISQRILSILANNINDNHYFFVNSIRFITSMIKKCNLTNDNCRVIYSRSNDIKLKVRNGYPSDLPKKINLITKACFEGVDFLDKQGLTYVVSDAHSEHTLIDISTQLQQIAGRIRNSKYNTVISHVYTTTPFSKAENEEQFILESEKSYEYELKIAAINADYEAEDRERLAKEYPFKYHYFDESINKLVADPNILKYEKYAFKLKHNIYRSHDSVSKEYQNRGLNQISKRFQIMPHPDLLANKRTSFKHIVIELQRLHEAEDNHDEGSEYSAFLNESTVRIKELNDILRYFSFEEIRDKDYHIGNILKTLRSKKPKPENKAQQLLIQQELVKTLKFEDGAKLESKNIKTMLKEVYKLLKVDRNANATQIHDYYDANQTNQSSKSYYRIISKWNLE